MHMPIQAPTRKELRNFGLIMGAMVVLFFGLLLPWLVSLPVSIWTWGVAAGFAVAGLLLPAVLRPIHYLWMRLGLVLGWINSRIILAIVFYGFVLPMGLVMRLMGKDPMARRLDPEKPSYRIPSKHSPREQIERPF